MQLLLVRHSNLGPILYRFGAIAGFCASVPLLFHLIWGVSPLDKIVAVGSMWASILSYSAVKLFSKYSNLCDHFTIHQRHRQRDGQTDDNIMQSNPKTALCTIYRSSRGKKNCICTQTEGHTSTSKIVWTRPMWHTFANWSLSPCCLLLNYAKNIKA